MTQFTNGVDLFLADPHTSIDSDDDTIKALADNVGGRGLVIGSAVAPVWPPVGGGSAMDPGEGRRKYLDAIRDACRIMGRLRELGARNETGVIRIDTATGVDDWAADSAANTAIMADTISQACDIAEDHGERLAAEGEICWGGMHSWKHMVELFEAVNRPNTLGFQADLAHTLLFTMGYNAPEHQIITSEQLDDSAALDDALRKITDALRPWTIDFHVAQNDGTVHGIGYHDKTGHHCMATDPKGKLDIVKHAGFWLNNSDGSPTKAMQHICWDGCMFPNSVLETQQTWNDILAAMIQVRNAHGWNA